MTELNSKQRKLLEKYAHPLEPVVIVGGAGVSEGVTEKTLQSLNSHELIKIKFNEFKDEKNELSAQLAADCNAVLVRIIGNVAILYKAKDEAKNQKYQKELDKLQ